VNLIKARGDRVNADLACGSCSRRVSEMRGTCEMCGRDSDGIRRDVEPRVEPLLRLHNALTVSRHIYAEYERALVEQELRRYGIFGDRPTRAGTTAAGRGRGSIGALKDGQSQQRDRCRPRMKSPHRGGEAALTTRSSRLRTEHARRTSAHPLARLAHIPGT
jgi:hypothetical protein